MAQKGRVHWIMDREAYLERRAIMEVEGVDPLTASRAATDYAYQTRLGKAATAMANGDRKLAEEWRAEIAGRFGQDVGDELMRDIEQLVETELAFRR